MVAMSLRRKPTVVEKAPLTFNQVLAAGLAAKVPSVGVVPADHGISLALIKTSVYDGANVPDREESTWALVFSHLGVETAFPENMSGDIFHNFKTISSWPLQEGDNRVQSVLNSFFKGWGELLRQMGRAEKLAIIEGMGYRVP